MDWDRAIERNREALKRILASLVAMAGLEKAARGLLPPPRGEGGGQRPPGGVGSGSAPTLPRHLHRAVLRLLRPAESAARRLVIVAARGLVVDLPPARPRKPKPNPTILRNGIGTGIVMPRHIFAPPPLTPPHKGEGIVYVAPGLAANALGGNASESPSPLWGGVRGGGGDSGRLRGGGKAAPTRTLSLPLFDPKRRPPRRRASQSGIPRISIPGLSEPAPIRRRPSRHDPIDAGRLLLRLAALSRALDDLPREARRFARWKIARDAASAQNRKTPSRGRVRRIWPLRFGRPPGQRSARSRRPHHEVHDVLGDMQYFAHEALERPDTS